MTNFNKFSTNLAVGKCFSFFPPPGVQVSMSIQCIQCRGAITTNCLWTNRACWTRFVRRQLVFCILWRWGTYSTVLTMRLNTNVWINQPNLPTTKLEPYIPSSIAFADEVNIFANKFNICASFMFNRLGWLILFVNICKKITYFQFWGRICIQTFKFIERFF